MLIVEPGDVEKFPLMVVGEVIMTVDPGVTTTVLLMIQPEGPQTAFKGTGGMQTVIVGIAELDRGGEKGVDNPSGAEDPTGMAEFCGGCAGEQNPREEHNGVAAHIVQSESEIHGRGGET
jgi:hypothetical protein